MRWLIDAHVHLDHKRFDEDRDELIDGLWKDGILAAVNPGSDRESSSHALTNAQKHKNIFACVGTHPHEAKFYDQDLEDQYRKWAGDDKVVAIGEIGLDYYYEHSPRDVQRDVFEKQLQLAKDLDLPVVIHTRDSAEDTYDVMKNFGSSIRAVMHSFSEDMAWADRFLDFGYYVSLSGMMTFKNAVKPVELAKNLPTDRLFIETDAPYLAPVPKRGKRNIPQYTHYSLEALADFRGQDPDLLADQLVSNTAKFYDIEEEIQELRESYEAKS